MERAACDMSMLGVCTEVPALNRLLTDIEWDVDVNLYLDSDSAYVVKYAKVPRDVSVIVCIRM